MVHILYISKINTEQKRVDTVFIVLTNEGYTCHVMYVLIYVGL
jgi:hypothetical protein